MHEGAANKLRKLDITKDSNVFLRQKDIFYGNGVDKLVEGCHIGEDSVGNKCLLLTFRVGNTCRKSYHF